MRSNEEVEQQMFAMIQSWQQSGLTQKAYCQEHAVSYHIFHYWYKRYRVSHHLQKNQDLYLFTPSLLIRWLAFLLILNSYFLMANACYSTNLSAVITSGNLSVKHAASFSSLQVLSV